MRISLSTASYATFLNEFRLADRRGSASTAETEVEYISGGSVRRYYYRRPNFELVAYDVSGERITLVNYQHVANPGASVGRRDFEASLLAGGGGGNYMNAALSRVVALTSEAARSTVVETAIKNVLASVSRTFNLERFSLLFKSYAHTAKHVGYLDVAGSYAQAWRPLRKDDYVRFFSSTGYTGASVADCALVHALADAPPQDAHER
jgi:hypothetical protein